MNNQREKEDVERLMLPENQRILNALFHMYDAYKDVVAFILENPTKISNELNVFYRNTFIPIMNQLVTDLQLEPNGSSVIKLPVEYAPFPNLFLAGTILKDQGKSKVDGLTDIFGVYGTLKEMIEDFKAVHQEPSPFVEKAINGLLNLVLPREEKIKEDKPKKYKTESWGGVTITFINQENVIIKIENPKLQDETNYDALGFMDHKAKKPNTAWNFLLLFAKNGGEITQSRGRVPGDISKQKQVISNNLKKLFEIDDNPFYPYNNKSRSYKLKLVLTPPVLPTRADELDRELFERAQEQNRNTRYVRPESESRKHPE